MLPSHLHAVARTPQGAPPHLAAGGEPNFLVEYYEDSPEKVGARVGRGAGDRGRRWARLLLLAWGFCMLWGVAYMLVTLITQRPGKGGDVKCGEGDKQGVGS